MPKNPNFARSKRSLSRRREASDHEASEQFFFDLTGREIGEGAKAPVLTQRGIVHSTLSSVDIQELEARKRREVREETRVPVARGGELD